MNNGDRVRVRKTGESAIFIRYQRFPQTWWGGKPDPPMWAAVVQYVNGDHDLLHLDNLERLERTAR